MKKVILAVCFVSLCHALVIDQLPDEVNKATANLFEKANPGALLTRFANAIKPTSFTSAWTGQKNSWLDKVGKATDAIGMAQGISSLAGFIKPGMFKRNFDVNNLLNSVATVKTIADATGLLKNLEGGLKPAAMLGSWNKQRSGWLNALNLLQ